jgi:aspartyl-tRNA(Asn)/glutamyl-tRNA(Gln) amidotransferase subunit C
MSITPEEIKKLASLARIRVSEEEVASLGGEIDAILGYIADINKVSLVEVSNTAASSGSSTGAARANVFREDDDAVFPATVPGTYTEKLLALSPDRDGSYVRVKKIL